MTNLTSEQYRNVLKHIEGTEKIPTVQNVLRKAVETFFLSFGDYPELAGVAPGKVVIFGEKTQSSSGLGLSLAIPLVTIVVGRLSEGPHFSVVTSANVAKPHKVTFSFSKNRPLGPGCPFWLNHVKGVIDNFKNYTVPPFEAAIESSIPIGSGFGSSSAIETAIYTFLEILVNEKSGVFEKARACQEASKNFVLKEVGLFDRVTSSAAWDRQLLLIDLQNDSIQKLPMKNKNLAFVYINSHFPNVVEDNYAEEKEYCKKACEILKISNLRKCTEEDINNLQLLVNKILEENKNKFQKGNSAGVEKKDEENLEKIKETEETKKKKVSDKINNKNIDNSPTTLEDTNKKNFDSKRFASENTKSLKKREKRQVKENEEIEINGEEEIENENDLLSAEFYERMIENLKFFLAETKSTDEAANALQNNNFIDFGEKMIESHELSKNFYNFHLPLLDFLVQISVDVEGVLGSKMLGKNSGGGGVLTLIRKKNIPDYCRYIMEKYKENEKELKEKCASLLHDFLLTKKSEDNKRKLSVASPRNRVSTVSSLKINKVENCLNKITPTIVCNPKTIYCKKQEKYLKGLLNPCEENMLNTCGKYSSPKKHQVDEKELKLRRKESFCKEIRPKYCGTWSRYPKNFLYKKKFSKQSKKENSERSSKEISSIEEESNKKNMKNQTLIDGKNGKTGTNKKENSKDKKNGKTVFSNLEEGYEKNGRTKKKLSASEENKTKNLDNNLKASSSDILSPSIAEEITKVIQANLSFYVFSPFTGAKMMFITKNDILRSMYANPVPHPKALLRSAIAVFNKDYKNKPTAVGIAPGTLTLFGEFMEFQLGYIISMALSMVTVMVGGKNDSVNFSVKTTCDQIEQPNEMVYPIPCVRPLEIESRNWANFIMGTVNEFKGHVPGFNAVINSSLPVQTGLNSCAALQASTFTFLENLTGVCHSDPFEKVDLCGKSEFEFNPQPSELVTKCSSIKFFPTFLCKEGHLMFINCKRYKITQYFFDHPSYVFLIASCKRITTNVTVESLDERLKKCVQALEILHRNSLLSIETKHLKCLQKKAPENIIKRVKYIMSEHERTIEAVKAIKNKDYARVGLLMNQSHASLRDDYEVSSPEIELIIKLAKEVDGVLGAKMLGKGLTATVVILVNIFAADDCIRYVRKNYKPKTDRPQFYITKPSRGAYTMSPFQVFNIP